MSVQVLCAQPRDSQQVPMIRVIAEAQLWEKPLGDAETEGPPQATLCRHNSLCGPGWPETHDNPPASLALGSQA